MTSAQGCRKEAECWGKRSEWMDYSGTVEGQKVGISIFDNPGNPRFPTYWHALGRTACSPSNIFGLHEFTKGKETNGALTLKPGEKLRFQFRVVIHPGDAATAKVDELYKTYAASAVK